MIEPIPSMKNSMGPLIGILLTTFNDLDMSRVVYDEMMKSVTSRPYAFVVVDAGSTDGTVEWWEHHALVIHAAREDITTYVGQRDADSLKHLSIALNVGINNLKNQGAKYICWIHADMKFPQENWIDVLVDRLERDPEIGKIAPDDVKWGNQPERVGNNCPHVVSVEMYERVAEQRRKVHGDECDKCSLKNTCPLWFCEKFIGIGGYEDWDLNAIIMDVGKKVIITPESKVDHEGMGTRQRRDTTGEAKHNAGVYCSRYKTGDPPC